MCTTAELCGPVRDVAHGHRRWAPSAMTTAAWPAGRLASLLRRSGVASFLVASALTVSAAAAADKPKVMIVVDEKVAGVFGTTGWETVGQAESALAAKFIAAGYPVVDAQVVKRNIARDKALKLIEGDDKGAALAGLQFGAQLVITGQALSKNAGGRLLGTSMQSLQATVQARAVRADDARVVATGVAQSSKAHIDEVQGGVLAIREASDEVADTLLATLSQQGPARPATAGAGRAAAATAAGTEVQMVVTGLVSYRHLSFIQQYLGQMQGVRRVRLRQFASGTAELSIDVAGDTPAIAEALAHQQFTGFRLEPTSVTPNRLDIRAVVER